MKPWQMDRLSRRATALGPVIAAVAVLIGAGSAAADCTALQTQAVAAQKQGDVATLKAVHEQVAVTPGCDDRFRAQLGLVVAKAIERRVYQAAEANQPLAPYEQELADSLRYARLWRPLAWLGDIARERKDHGNAARFYQESLAVIQDEQATPQAPPPAAIEAIFKRAEQSRLLAAEFVAAPRTRSGGVGGLGASDIRGYVPRSVSVPIEFGYNSIELTPKGWNAAQELLEQLRTQSPARVTLIGHTDPRGSAVYNQRLSVDRAQAVANFLRVNGYFGDVHIEGRGEREPLAVDPGSGYTVDELYQLHRRVELRR